MSAIPLAKLGMIQCMMQGVKRPQDAWINPYGEILKTQEAQSEINPEVARTFLQLHQSGKVPSWVGKYLDFDFIFAASRGFAQ